MLQKNDNVPTKVQVLNQKKEKVILDDYLGQPLVIYFYPKDNTPGCTVEAKGFRDVNRKIEELGAKVIGISTDSVKSHQNFSQKHDLNFELLSDPDHQLQEKFGVWQEKRMFGKTYMGTVRSTFVVDGQGKILRVWPRVKPADHAREIYQFLQSRDN